MSGGMGQMTDKFSMLSGLGIRPDWIRQNPEKAAVIGAAAAAPFTGGASLAAVGPGAAAGGAAAAGLGAEAATLGTEAAVGGGLLGGTAAATPEVLGAAGSQALAAAAPAVNAAPGVGMLEASGAAGDLGATSSGVGAAGQAANPLSVGLGNFQNSSVGQGLDKGMDAFKTYNKVNSAVQAGQPQQPQTRTVSKPPANNGQVAPLSQSTFGGGAAGPFSGGLMGGGMGTSHGPGSQDSARQMILKRLGLLGGFQ
jgi:hypothetical protein